MSNHAENLRLAVKTYAGNYLGCEVTLSLLADTAGMSRRRMFDFTGRGRDGPDLRWGEGCEILRHCPPEVAAMALRGVGYVPVIRTEAIHSDPFRLMGDVMEHANALVSMGADGVFCHRDRMDVSKRVPVLLTAAAMYRDGSAAGAG